MSQQIQISGGAKVRDLQDVIIGTSGVLSSVAFNVANGVPKLDVNGKILVSQLPNSVMEYKGVWNAATNSPTLTNGGAFNQGDVYLCDTAGTVNFGSGSPISFIVGDQAIYSGSVWQKAGGATGTVTSVGLSTNGGAITIGSSPITTSGTITANFNGTNLQYVNGAGNLTTFPTLITSIGLTMPSAFSVANSPLTANGTIAVTGAGFASQYIRGDGTLADFPSSGGGGSSVSYYLNGGTSQGTIGGVTYYEMSKIADTGTMVDFTKTGDGFIVAFLTDANDPAQLNIPAGNWNYEIYASMSSNGGTPQLYAELYVYNGTTFTLISTSSNEILYDGTNLNLYTFAMTVPATTLALTDRLAIKLYATNSGGKTTTVHTQDSHLCQVITTFSTGITALNGLTAQVQYFQTGTSGTDFNISSTTATHTFNIPDASATARGLITTGTQTIAGTKTFSDATKNNGGILLQNASSSSLAGYMNLGGLTNGVKFTSGGGVSNTFTLPSATGYTFTFPNATGTIALTSDLIGYVTLATAQTISGVKTFSTYQLLDAGILIKHGANITASGYTGIGAITTGLILGLAGGGSGSLIFNTTSNNSYTFPNASGTLALTSDLGAYLPLAGGTLTGALGGTSAVFSSSVNGSFFSVIPSTNYNAQFDYTGGTRISQTAPATEGTDSMTFVINGGSTSTTGNAFIFKTQTGNTTPSAVLTMLKTGASEFSSSVTATSFVKTSGTSSQFLKADGSVDSSTYLTTSAASSTYLPLTGGTLTGALGGTSATFSSNVFTLRSNIGTGTSDDADTSLNVSAPSGANKFIMFGRNGANVAVFAINSAGYLGATGGDFIAASGTAMNVAGNAIFRGDTGVGTPRQLIITSGGSTPVYLEAKGYGANYQTDFGIKTFNSVGTAFEVFYADSSGRVGINRVAPSYQLDVNGTGRFEGALRVNGGTTTIYGSSEARLNFNTDVDGEQNSSWLYSDSNATLGSIGYVYLQALSTTVLSVLDFNNYGNNTANGVTGNVFIGTSVAQGIDKGAVLSLGGWTTSTGSPSAFGRIAGRKENATSGNQAGYLSFETANALVSQSTEKMRITSTGNVGIGTPTPTAKLDVNGEIRMTGSTLFRGMSSNTLQLCGGTSSSNVKIDGSVEVITMDTNGATRLTIASTGGATFTSTVQANLAFRQYAAVGYYADFAYSGSTYNLGSSETTDNIDFKIAGGGTFSTGGGFRFFTQAGGSTPVERINIKSGGQLNINGVVASAQIKLGILQTQNNHTAYLYVNNGSGNANVYSRVDATANVFSYFDYNGTVVGSVSTNGTTTAYNITSDYRLKQDFKNYNGLDLISAIKTYDYEWKSDKSRMYGVIAHELQEILPYAVTGIKDGEQMQGVDYSKIVPILIKSIQEQQKQIEELKLKIK